MDIAKERGPARMKIAYGTYAMPTVPLEEAIPLLGRIGYDGVELCIGPKPFDTLPDEIDTARRRKLASLLAEHRLSVPALMNIRRSVLTDDETVHDENLEHARKAAQLARDLGAEDDPVLSMGIGGRTALWDTQRDQIIRRLHDYARVASEEGFVLAAEAHCGAAVDRTERALHVINTVNDPRIRLHFDIVHFFLARERIEDSVRALVPITAHTHVSDAIMHEDGGFEFRLPSEGHLDMVAYVKAMHDNGWTDFITLEVSTRVWSKEDYDPREAALSCYEMLSGAFEKAGVPRG